MGTMMNGNAVRPVEGVGLPVARSTVVEKVVSAVVEYISAANLSPGERLPSEAKLAGMFGVSRLALREALNCLKTMGVVEARHGAGWFVRRFEPASNFRMLSPLLKNFTGADLNQIMQVRMILEPGIAGVAAANMTAAGIDELRKCLDGMRTHIESRERFIEEDMSFHSVMARECGNDILAVLCAILTDLSRSAQWAYRDSVENRKRSLEYHRAILGGIESGDCAGAEQAMREHIREVGNRLEGR